MLKGKKTFKIAGDFLYTIMATIVINIVLQMIIYPLVTRFRGEAVTGEILYFIGFIYIIPQALGVALANTRLVLRKSTEATNGDYDVALLISSIISVVACGFIGFMDQQPPYFFIAYALFSAIYLLRAYVQMEFRLTLNFKGYFLYYCLISIGYLIGFGLYMLTNVWLLIFLLGELLALGHTLIKGNLLKKEKAIGVRATIGKTMLMIALSTLMYDCVIQFDKVVLKQLVSEAAVTQYHVVSLIAKTMQMLTQPTNVLIMAYLTVKNSQFSKKNYMKFFFLALSVSVVFCIGCLIGTPIFVRLFYNELYDTVMQYSVVVNIGLILNFFASLFMSILLSQGKTKLHTWIECVYGVCYILLIYWTVTVNGIWGLAQVTLIAGFIKSLIAIVCSFGAVSSQWKKEKTLLQ